MSEVSESRSPLSYLSPKVEVRTSAIHGRGLFACEPISESEIVCVKGGYVFSRRQLEAMWEGYAAAEVPIGEDLFIGPMYPEERDGGMIFSNHSCEPNIGVKGQIVFVAIREIAAGEELTHDWAMTDDDDDTMECRCGAPTCRGVVTGKDWQRRELQEKYRGYFSWYIEEKIRRSS